MAFKVEWFTAESTIAALREFRKYVHLRWNKKIYLVMDNAPWHKKAKRLIEEKEEYKDLKESIVFVDMPPYSPDLNPIEQVWRVTRREVTHNRYWSSLCLLEATLEEYFNQFRRANKKLRSLCSFNFDKPKKMVQHRERKKFREPT